MNRPSIALVDGRPGSFTIAQLEAFVATIDAGSFTGAADALDVSQPAIAEHVHRLEGAVGQSLFARVPRGVRPTRIALALEPHARRAVDAVREAVAAASREDDVGVGSVAFGTFGSPHHYGLSELVHAFLRDHPGTRVRILGRNSSSTADDVRSGALDAAVVALPIDDGGLDVRPLFVGEVFYVSADARNTRRPVTIEMLATRPLILYESGSGVADPTRRQLAERAQAAGVTLRPRIEVEGADTAIELAAAGLGDTYAPQVLGPAIAGRLHAVSFEPHLVDTFALVTRAGSRVSRPVQAFVERATSHLLARVELGRMLADRAPASARSPAGRPAS